MANTKQYLSHLLQNTGITPACSEEERAAADVIAKVFSNHGFSPEIQEFSASGGVKIVQAGLGVAVFVGAVLSGIGGGIGVMGQLLAIAALVLYVMERTGRPVLSGLVPGGLSQNVIAYHQASGPLASPRNRPVVVVAHYDSPREDPLAREPFAAYRPLIAKLLPYAMAVPAVVSVIRIFPIPGAAKTVLWLLAIAAALVPLACGVAVIANRFVLPYTSGAVCNKSSVAAMLGVMDAVAPYEMGDEFPQDTPADEYFDEQRRILEEAIAAAEAAAEAEAAAAAAYPHEIGTDDELQDSYAGDETADGDEESIAAVLSGEEPSDAAAAEAMGSTTAMDAGGLTASSWNEAEVAEPENSDGSLADSGFDPQATQVAMPVLTVVDGCEPEQAALDLDAQEFTDPDVPFTLNSEGNVRFGEETIRGLGMLPASCSIVYEADRARDAAPGSEVVPALMEVVEPAPMPMVEEACVEPVESAPKTACEELVALTDEAACYDEAPAEPVSEPTTEETPEVSEGEVAVLEVADFEPVVEYDSENNIVEAGCESVDGEPDPEQVGRGGSDQLESTQIFSMSTPGGSSYETDDAGSTVAMQMPKMDTVDALMSEIGAKIPAAQARRSISVPSTADAPVPHTPPTANRASLFDLPDPSSASVDPFASPASAGQLDSSAAAPSASKSEGAPEPIDTMKAPEPEPEKPRRGLARFFGRKKRNDDSMSNWLGVDDSFDAKKAGSDIGSWDDFDDDGWKGGAAGSPEATEEELREAVASMGDDELLGHDIWFVATGASENGNAGIQAFLDSHRDKLRGVFLINLESVGAGELSVLATEGGDRVLKGDRRIMKLVQRVSSDFHHEFARVDMAHETTDAHVAMSMSLRSLTVAGIDGTGFALSHTDADQPYNVDTDNVALASDVVTEVIRRS